MSGMRCFLPHAKSDLLRAPALQAMRHIVFADFQRLFHFHLGAENLASVQLCAERFVQYHLGVCPEALTFYHKITAPVLHSEEEPHEQEL